jgi:hypothetical protein
MKRVIFRPKQTIKCKVAEPQKHNFGGAGANAQWGSGTGSGAENGIEHGKELKNCTKFSSILPIQFKFLTV